MKHILLRMMQLFLVILLVAGAALFVVSRDKPATHLALQSANLAPLIAVRDFYADPFSNWGYKPSFDGTLVSYWTTNLRGQQLRIKDVASNREITQLPPNIRNLRWHPEKPLIRFIQSGHDFEVDPQNPARENWRDISPVDFAQWSKVKFPATGTEDLIVIGNRFKRTPKSLYRVSQVDDKVTLLETSVPETVRWITDTDGRARLRIDTIDGFSHVMARKDGDIWTHLLDFTVNDTFVPYSYAFPDAGPYFLSSRGRDTTALVQLDLQTGAETVLFNDPDFDILELIHFGRTPHEIDVLVMETDTRHLIPLTARGTAFKSLIEAHGNATYFDITGTSANGRFVTLALSEHQQSFRYYLFDLDKQSEIHLNDFGFYRHSDKLTEVEIARFDARDGLSIPAYLSLPKGFDPKTDDPIPFVLRVHGGPSGGEFLKYDHEVQFLNNRGYGTLSVNFRGSIGYGRAFQAAGFRQFGRAMQDDIVDGAKWLADQGLADPENIAIMGSSYGGYSAALAMTRDPGLFAAAIVEFPLLDVEFQSRHFPLFWNNSIGSWTRYFGDPANPDDVALMREYSPTNHVENITGPILLTAGKRDAITGYQQAARFETAALAAGKDITSHLFKNEGHGLRDWKNRVARARLIEDFLAKHLGGRSGRFDYSELAPDFIQ